MKDIDGLVAKYAKEAAEKKIPYPPLATPEQERLADEERKELADVLEKLAAEAIVGTYGEIRDGIDEKIPSLIDAINFAQQKGLIVNIQTPLVKPEEGKYAEGSIIDRAIGIIETRLNMADDDGNPSVAELLKKQGNPVYWDGIAYSILDSLLNNLDVKKIVNRDVDEAYHKMIALKSFGLRMGSLSSGQSTELGQ